MKTFVFLCISNIFMVFAWYGHLKHKSFPLLWTILISWGIAFFEYCFQVPANRWGSEVFSTIQLKMIQEAIHLVIFCLFLYFYMNERLQWNHLLGLCFLFLAVFFVFKH